MIACNGKLFKAVLLCALLILAYGLGQWLLKPEVFFRAGHLLFMLALLSWSLVAALDMCRRQERATAAKRSENAREAWGLLGVSLLILGAFVLAGQGRALSGNAPARAVAWWPFSSHLGQAGLAGGSFVGLLWLVHLCFRKLVPERDPWLFPLVCLLCGIGLVFLYRLGPDIAAHRGLAGFEHLFQLQLRSLGISLCILLGSVAFFSPARLERLTRKRYLYVLLSVLLISVTAVWGTEIHGRRLSLDLGFINFQTVELVKILALLFMVSYFRYEQGFLESGKNLLGLPRERYLVPYLFMWVVTLLPLFLQRDLGPTALLFALFLVMLYLGTGSASAVVFGFVLLGAIGTTAYVLGYPSMVRTRVDMWLHPFQYSQNLAEAFWALAAGGVFGVGSGLGLGYLIPVVQSDFNFAALAEEWGLAGVAALLTCFALLIIRTLQLAMRATAAHEQLLLSGLAALWLLQTFIIVGGNLGVLPLTGITLPFLSFGGSSLLVNFLALGIIIRFSAGSRQ